MHMKEMGKFYSFLWILLLINLTTSKDIQINPGLNKVKLSQSDDAFPKQIQKRVETYKVIDANENCSTAIKSIQANCTDMERPICVRNRTYKNLVAVCAPNIPMPGYPASCPVFTTTITTPPIPIVQPDPIATCENCSHYSVWDIEKYPECLRLENETPTPHTSDTPTTHTSVTPTTHTSDVLTTHTSDVTRSSAGRKEQQENGLSGGSIAGIVIAVIVPLVVVLALLYRFGYLMRLTWKKTESVAGLSKIRQCTGQSGNSSERKNLSTFKKNSSKW